MSESTLMFISELILMVLGTKTKFGERLCRLYEMKILHPYLLKAVLQSQLNRGYGHFKSTQSTLQIER